MKTPTKLTKKKYKSASSAVLLEAIKRKEHGQRAFIAGNRIGKTLTGAYEVTCHLTGIYPDWWEGRKFLNAGKEEDKLNDSEASVNRNDDATTSKGIQLFKDVLIGLLFVFLIFELVGGLTFILYFILAGVMGVMHVL